MQTDKIHFTKEKETLLITLYGKAVQSQWPDPILRDPWAEEAIRHIDYDFSKIYYGGKVGYMAIAIRAYTFDLLTNRYLAEHPNATVLHLGCGMDTRLFRIDLPGNVNWFDVDYPEVIDLREKLYPRRDGYHMIGSPLEDLRWLDEVPRDRPALVLAEGVLPYLAESDVKALLNAFTHHFTAGQVVFDAFLPWVVKRAGSNVGNTGATYKWGIDNPQEIQKLEPKLELIREIRMTEMAGYSRYPLAMRASLRVMALIPALRRMYRVLHYRF